VVVIKRPRSKNLWWSFFHQGLKASNKWLLIYLCDTLFWSWLWRCDYRQMFSPMSRCGLDDCWPISNYFLIDWVKRKSFTMRSYLGSITGENSMCTNFHSVSKRFIGLKGMSMASWWPFVKLHWANSKENVDIFHQTPQARALYAVMDWTSAGDGTPSHVRSKVLKGYVLLITLRILNNLKTIWLHTFC